MQDDQRRPPLRCLSDAEQVRCVLSGLAERSRACGGEGARCLQARPASCTAHTARSRAPHPEGWGALAFRCLMSDGGAQAGAGELDELGERSPELGRD